MQFTDNEILFISELLIKILNADIKQRVKSDIQEILDKSFDTTEIKVSVSKEDLQSDLDTISLDSKTLSSDDTKTVTSDDTKTVSSDDSKNNDDTKITKKRGRPKNKPIPL
jgi:hypothetical protein